MELQTGYDFSEAAVLWWVATQQDRKRRKMRACMASADYAHIRFIRLGCSAEIERFAAAVENQPSPAPPSPSA